MRKCRTNEFVGLGGEGPGSVGREERGGGGGGGVVVCCVRDTGVGWMHRCQC